MTLQKLTVHLTTIIFGAAIALVLVITGLLPVGTASADSDATLACVDQNGNGLIDKQEVIDVIAAYLWETPIPPPEPTPPATPTPTSTATPTLTPTPPPGDGTSRSKAWPYGYKFQAGNFDMQITSVDLDAWPEILEENQFNDPPDDGYRFVMWTMDVENVRGSVDESEYISYTDFELVGSRNVQYLPYGENSCGVIPDDLWVQLYRGGGTTGNVCFAVPTDETGLTFLYDTYHDDAEGELFSVEVWFKGLPPSN